MKKGVSYDISMSTTYNHILNSLYSSIELLEDIGKGDNYFTAKFDKTNGYRRNYDGIYYYLEIRDYNLNDEVEIIEEEPRNIEVCGSLFTKSEYDRLAQSKEEKKIPEKLGKIDDNDGYIDQNDVIKIGKKVDEIIDYLYYLKSKGE